MKNVYLLMLLALLFVPSVYGAEMIMFLPDTVANNSVIAGGGFFNINVTYSGFNLTRSYLNITNIGTQVSNITNRTMTVPASTNITNVVLNDITPTGAINWGGLGNNGSTLNISINFTTTLGGTADVFFRGVYIGNLTGTGSDKSFDGLQTKVNITVSGDNNITFNRTSGLSTTVTISRAIIRRTVSTQIFDTRVQPVNGTYSFEHIVIQANQSYSTGVRYVTVGSGLGMNVSVVNLSLNGNSSNITIFVGQNVTAIGDILAGNMTQPMDLFINGIFAQSGTEPLTNFSIFPLAGTYDYFLRLNASGIFNGSNDSGTVFVIAFPVTPMNQSTIFTTGVCPNSTIPEMLIFVFVGFFLLGLLLVNMLTIKIPILNLLVGLGLVFYSFTMFGCSTSMGIIVFVIGLMIMASTMLVS